MSSSLLHEGIRHFNAGRYFEAHEALELVWKTTAGPERELYQGIIQAAVGFYHLKQGHWHPALLVFRRALPRLRAFSPGWEGIEVDRLARGVETAMIPLERFEDGGPEPSVAGPFPKIAFSNSRGRGEA